VSYKSRLYVAGERASRGHRFLFRYVDSLLLDTLTAKVIVSNISDSIWHTYISYGLLSQWR